MSHTVTTIEVLLYSQARSSVKKNANRIRQQWTTSYGKNRQGLEKDFELLLQSFYIKKHNRTMHRMARTVYRKFHLL